MEGLVELAELVDEIACQRSRRISGRECRRFIEKSLDRPVKLRAMDVISWQSRCVMRHLAF